MRTNRQTSRHGRARAAITAVLIACALSAAGAQTVFQNPDFEYIVDIPVGWEAIDAEQTNIVSFSDPERVAVFQVLAFPEDRFATVEEIDRFIRRRFSAEGDSASYRYLGDPAIFADYQFSTENFPVRGYMAFVNREEIDYAVMTYIPEEFYEQYREAALSALDSFSPTPETRNAPGPVSQFFSDGLEEQAEAAAGGRNSEDAKSRGDGTPIELPEGSEYVLPAAIRSEEVREAHQVVIEREARVLNTYAPPADTPRRPGDEPAPAWVRAWRRYYRMLFRDSFPRLEPVAEAIFMDMVDAGVAREDMPARILEWLQTAEFERTRSLSDLMSPAACLVNFRGDCDSLGLTYAILLHHLGFEAIMMVSAEYSHALVGVDVPGEGARFPFRGREWLVAELTEEVGIGRIAQEMSDIGGWIGIKLDPTVVW